MLLQEILLPTGAFITNSYDLSGRVLSTVLGRAVAVAIALTHAEEAVGVAAICGVLVEF